MSLITWKSSLDSVFLSVRHRDIVFFVQADGFFLKMRYLCAGCVENVRLALDGDHRGLRPVQRVALFILYFNLLMQVAGIQFRVDRAGRSPVFLCADFIRGFPGAVIFLNL